MELLSLLLALGCCGLAILSLAGFFSRYNHWLDICDHFRLQYLVLSVILAVVGFFIGQRLCAVLAIIFALLNLAVIFPIYVRPTGWKRGPAEGRLLLANVLRQNTAYVQLLELIRSSQPDLIGLVEPDQEWLDSLAAIKDSYPYQHVAARQDNYGLALFSRRPLEHLRIHVLTAQDVPTLSARLDFNGIPLTILLTHPPPPKNIRDLRLRNQQMERLAELAGSMPGELIVCGDFNTSPWSGAFRRLARQANLVDSTHGFGYQPTWPVNHWWQRVPIDHCLVSRGIRVYQRQVGPRIGSDHFPLLVDFGITIKE